MANSRISISVPPDVLENLDRLSRFLSVSRSSVIVGLMTASLEQTTALLDALGDTSSPDVQKLQRVAYDRIAQLDVLMQGVRDDVSSLQ